MENQSNLNQDCGCSDGCCTPPKKKNNWSKIGFLIIILAAGLIITMKLVNKQGAEKCCDKTENPACCSKTEK